MGAIDCFTKHGNQKLIDQFNKLIEGGKEETDAAREVVLSHHKELSTSLNEFKKTIGAKTDKYKEQKYPQKEIDAINKTFEERKMNEGGEPPKSQIPVIADEGEGDLGGITHAANAERRSEQGLGEYEKSKETFEAWDAEADKKLKEGFDVEDLYSRIEQGHDPTPIENAIRKKYVATLDSEIKNNPTDELLAKQKRAIEVGDLANSRAGRNLVSLKGEGSPLETISDFYVAKMEAAGVDKLTDQQKADVQAQFDSYEKAKTEAEAKIKELEELNAKLQAEKSFAKTKSITGKKSAKTKESFQKEREDIRKSISDKLKKARNETNVVVVPYAKELFAIAPDVAKLVKSYAEEGVIKLEEIVKKIHSDVKDAIPGITERDVRDMVAGDYNKKRETESELRTILRDLKDEAMLLKKLEAILRGEEPATENKKIERNARIKELRDQIKALKKEKAEAGKEQVEKLPEDLKSILSAIETNKKKEAEYRQRVIDKNFEPKKSISVFDNPELKAKYPKEYNALLDAIIKREDAKHQFDIELQKDLLKKRSGIKQVADFSSKLLGTFKAIVAGIDDSAMFIQNMVAMTAHPRSGAKAAKQHILDAVSEKTFNRNLTQLHNSKHWGLMQKSGLDITEPKSLTAATKEEIFDNRFHIKFKVKGKEYDVEKFTLKPFERAFTSLGNNLRANMFIKITDRWAEEGMSFENNPKIFKDLATVLNTETGRGKLHEQVQKAADLISAGIWSPRLMASRLNVLGFGDLFNAVTGKKGYYANLDPRVRNMALADFAKFISVGASAMWLMSMAGAEADLDPLSPTFGTVKVGDKRYNMWGGFTQYVRFATQMTFGKRMVNGKVEDLGSGYGQKSRGDIGLKFLRGKLTPAMGVGADLITGADYFGKPITIKEEAKKLIAPLSLRDLPTAIEREGAAGLLTTTVPSFVGINVSNENDYKRSSNTKAASKSTTKKTTKKKD